MNESTTTEAAYLAALQDAVDLQRQIFELHGRLALAIDTTAESRLATLQERRSAVFAVLGERCVAQHLATPLVGRPLAAAELRRVLDEIRLDPFQHAPAPETPEAVVFVSTDASDSGALTAVDSQLQQETSEAVAAAIAAADALPTRPAQPAPPPLDPAALAALTEGKLGPAWARGTQPKPAAPLDVAALQHLLDEVDEAPVLTTERDLYEEADRIDAMSRHTDRWQPFPRQVQVLLVEIVTSGAGQ